MAYRKSVMPQLGEIRTQELAQGLGWFSVGLGLAELLAPNALARALGMRGSESLIRAYGARELVTGIGILSTSDPKPWIYGRVAGDALDLATLAPALNPDNPQRGNVGIAMAAVAGVTALDILCAGSLAAEETERLRQPRRNYSSRTGLPRGVGASRGAAGDFEVPDDFRIPEALRPFDSQRRDTATGAVGRS